MPLPARFFRRDPASHKGDFGHVFILAGSRRYTGAACLCAQASMRAGAGLVTVGVPKDLYPIAAVKLTEAMTLPLPQTKDASLAKTSLREIEKFLDGADSLLIGPGLSRNRQTQGLVRSVLEMADVPTVVDADALNALAGHLGLLKKKKAPFVLTPHPGEMARLLGASILSVRDSRKDIAKDFALRYNVILVLKGRGTVVASPGRPVYVNKTGNPGMATAGSGDVLSGILAAFLSQGLDAFDAACSAVYLHGLAGDMAAGAMTEPGLIASDIVAFLPAALKKCRSSSAGRAAVL